MSLSLLPAVRLTCITATFCAAAVAIAPNAALASSFAFTTGDLVISVYGDTTGNQGITDNQATPITLQEYSLTGTTSAVNVGSLVLPQTTTTTGSTTNYAISGEYGSSSEGTLELSGNGQYLTIAGYGVNAATYNANPQSYGGATKSCITSGASAVTCYPLAQTASVAGTAGSAGSGVTTATVVPRVIALIGGDGSVNTSTALTGVFNENNPRSVTTVNGTSFYISGQGASKSDTATQGVFLAQLGATSATQIYSTVDTRTVSIQNNQLYVSMDSTAGAGVTENISPLGTAGTLPTTNVSSSTSPLSGIKSKYQVTSANQLNSLDSSLGSSKIYLSPENYFFANSTTLYIADSGDPKGDNNGSGGAAQGLSDGGLQKWTLNTTTGVWTLDYTISAGLLNFVPDTTACTANEVNCGTTGLIGLTGEVVGNTVELFATNATLGDEDSTYLYGITDTLSNTTDPDTSATPSAESFSVLASALPGENIRGVAFAPTAAAVAVPEPSSFLMLAAGLAGLLITARRKA
jgi:hypothetical protein